MDHEGDIAHGPNWPRSDRTHVPVSFPGASLGYPGWVCKNACGRTWPADTKVTHCPECVTPLVRWVRYEERRR